MRQEEKNEEKGVQSVKGRERQQGIGQQLSQGMLSHFYSYHLSGHQPVTVTLKFTSSRVDPMQRKTMYHSLSGCATNFVYLCVLLHSKAQ